jgi:hypothetical protein
MYRMGRGDYAPGYYRGDPGLFSAIGHALSGVAHVAGGFLTGGPLGAARAAISVATSGVQRETLAAGGAQSALTPHLLAQHAQAVRRGRALAAKGAGIVTGGAAPAGARGPRRAPRMNPLNIKALRRANRRAQSFLHHVGTAVRYYTPKAPKGKPYVHFKKKAKR